MKQYLTSIMAIACLAIGGTSYGQDMDNLKLKDYRPESIYKIPITKVSKAKYPVIDIHTHPEYVNDDKGIAWWVRNMDECGIEKAILLTGETGSKFDSLVKAFSKYSDRFELWCGFDDSGYDSPGYGPAAVKELERCFRAGAKGVGELMFKGKGIPPSEGHKSIMLPDDPHEDLLFEKCADLGLPVNIHISEDKWMYEKDDSTNDGLMNSSTWQVKMENGAKCHEEMLARFENTLKMHPRTIFIAAHLANTCADLSVLGGFLDKYPNLYADISARFAEIAPIPKFVHDFIEKYQDRLLYGTDNMPDLTTYRLTFRLLETADEHFYAHYLFSYHWPLYGLYLSDNTLKKLYRDNALKIMAQRKR